MSQPRRRRRRRRRGRGGPPPEQSTEQSSQRAQTPSRIRESSAGVRRRRSRTGGRETASPKSSEDLVRATPHPRPESLTAPPDGTTLDQVIGELQSQWGVPQYPQEYRITIKIADERDTRVERVEDAPSPATVADRSAPRREKAPSAPRVDAPEGAVREQAPRRRRRGRRRGRGGPPAAPTA